MNDGNRNIYSRIAEKCLHGGTQNPNESVSNVIWFHVPKKIFVQIEILSLGTYDANSSFNMGNISNPEILRKLNAEPGDCTVQVMERFDKQRLLKVKYPCLQKNIGSVLNCMDFFWGRTKCLVCKTPVSPVAAAEKICDKPGIFQKIDDILLVKSTSAWTMDNGILAARISTSDREIGSRVGRNQITVMRICDHSMQEGTTDRRGRSHPPQCTTSREDRRIVRMAQSGLSARRPLLRLPLTQNHRRLHRKWCDERRMWAAEWNEVVFMDESRICLQHHDGQIRIWRLRGTRKLNSCVIHWSCTGYYGGIGYHSRTPLGTLPVL
ncbi:transposable element Tcb1 transposase [Trichonephila clavipes]|nr:transposable element Tcb1 transposase [Trichonephila clavipes]